MPKLDLFFRLERVPDGRWRFKHQEEWSVELYPSDTEALKALKRKIELLAPHYCTHCLEITLHPLDKYVVWKNNNHDGVIMSLCNECVESLPVKRPLRS